MSFNGYAFVWERELPQGPFAEGVLPGARRIAWATTGEFDALAKNHCGAVLVTNLALFFREQGNDRAALPLREETFRAVLNYVGPGPVAMLSRKARAYFRSRALTLVARDVPGFAEARQAIDAGEPCATLVARSPLNWHWVLCVGYRVYASGERFMRLADGWHNGTDTYFSVDSGAFWWSSTRYAIKWR